MYLEGITAKIYNFDSLQSGLKALPSYWQGIMKTVQLQNFKISVDCVGSKTYAKVSYPIRYGLYSEMDFNGFRFQFDLNRAVKYITGTGPDWPHPAEWLKRTLGNDWVYYSTGDYYSGVVDLFGEYYLLCPAYPTNSLFRENPFSRENILEAIAAVEEIAALARNKKLIPESEKNDILDDFQAGVGCNSSEQRRKRADQLHRILQAQVSVLPPDCRHVDYDVIPVMVADGCLYNCSFCGIKSGVELSCRTRDEITAQLTGLREFLGPELANYNCIFLGQHDTLAAEPDDILFAAEQAYEMLRLGYSFMNGPTLFLFGSAESFLKMDTDFWDRLNGLPYYSYINLGLESFDDNTLEYLKKPVRAGEGVKAFDRMLALNRNYDRIEVTANFILGEDLPAGHYSALLAHTGKNLEKHQTKGCIYLSPLKGSRNTRELLTRFREIKQRSRLDTFLYLIQRL